MTDYVQGVVVRYENKLIGVGDLRGIRVLWRRHFSVRASLLFLQLRPMGQGEEVPAIVRDGGPTALQNGATQLESE